MAMEYQLEYLSANRAGSDVRICTKLTVANTAASKRVTPSPKSFSRAYRSAYRFGGSPLANRTCALWRSAGRIWACQTAGAVRVGLTLHRTQRDHWLHGDGLSIDAALRSRSFYPQAAI